MRNVKSVVDVLNRRSEYKNVKTHIFSLKIEMFSTLDAFGSLIGLMSIRPLLAGKMHPAG